MRRELVGVTRDAVRRVVVQHRACGRRGRGPPARTLADSTDSAVDRRIGVTESVYVVGEVISVACGSTTFPGRFGDVNAARIGTG